MAAKNTFQTSVNASYVLHPAKGEVKVVVSAEKEKEPKAAVDAKTIYVKTYFSIDGNGGGYMGL